MILTLDGPVATNPYIGTSHLLVSIATVADTLALCEFAEAQKPYETYLTGFDASDGRSLAGSIRTKGGSYATKRRLELSFLATAAMLTLFEAILEAQRQGQSATVVDSWELPTTSIGAWLDVADRYRSPVGAQWNLLQFSAWEA
jgi:hypothetical protein